MKPVTQFLMSSIFLLTVMFQSCQSDEATIHTDDKLKVLSSFSILTEMVEAIGGDKVIVHNVVPIGTDPHEYQPRPNDIRFASGADLFVYNGLNLEGGEKGWFTKLLRSVKADPNKIFKIADQVTPLYLTEKDGSKEVNPHAFISPHIGIIMAEAVRDALKTVDPAHAGFYEETASEYILKLTSIDKLYRQKFGQIPEAQRVFIASEQAFQYLAKEYGLKEGFIWAIDTEENGSPEQLMHAIEFVRTYKPAVLFVESNVDTRPMKAISNETGVPIYSPAIFSDELGRPGQGADTYLKYLEYNLKHIYHGLTGNMEWSK